MPIHSRTPVMQTVDVTIGDDVFTGDPVQIGDLVIATPNSGGDRYARLQLNDGRSYRWDGNPDDATAINPDDEPRWILEQ